MPRLALLWCPCAEISAFPNESPEVKEAGGFIGRSQRCELHPETTAVQKFQEQIPKTAEHRADPAKRRAGA